MRKFLAIIFCLASLSAYSVVLASFAPNSSYQNTLTTGLVGYWTFDGQNMTATTVLDSSGNNNSGTLQNGAAPTAGQLGQAIKLDGTNDQVSFGAPSQLTGMSALTISFWRYITAEKSYHVYVAKSLYQSGYDIYSDPDGSGETAFNLKTSGANWYEIYVATAAPIGRWTHIVCLYDGTTMKIYYDGVQQSTNVRGGSSAGPSGTVSASGDFYIGTDLGNWLGGKIDDVRIYSRALSSVEITQLYNLEHSLHPNSTYANTLTAGLVGYWPFDGQYLTSTTATDVSGSGNNGTLGGTIPSIIGHLGQGLYFSPSARITVAVPVISAYPFSVSLWVNPLNTDNNNILVAGANSSTGLDDSWAVGLAGAGNGSVDCNVSDRTGAVSRTLYPCSLQLKANQWGHMVVVYTATDIKVYLNGRLAGTQTSTVTFPSGLDGVCIGQLDFFGNCAAFGDNPKNMDDVRIYNKELTQADVTQLYNAQHSLHPNSSQASTLTSGLVGMWDFNGPNLTTTTATDATGVTGNGTLTNGPLPAMGRIGQSIFMDGSNDEIRIGTPGTTVSGNYTLSVWGRLLNQPGGTNFKIFGTRNSGNTFDMGFGTVYSGAHADIGAGGGTWLDTNANASFTVVTGTWYHVVYVVTTTGFTAYVDGVQKGSGSWAANTPLLYDAGNAITIGNSSNSGGENWNGLIDEVRVYNRALSADEVYKLYSYGRSN